MVGITDVLARAARPLRALSAFRRRRTTDALGQASARPARVMRLITASRVIVVLALTSVGAMLICATIGYSIARNGDERLLTDQRIALRNAISEFRALFGHDREVDPRFVHMVEDIAGLKSLKFELAPQPGQREMQPVLDSDGRIAGFFTWERDYPTTQSFVRLLPLLFAIVATICGFAGVSLRQLRYACRELAASEEQVVRAADLDKLTGLSNRAKTLELLDLALAERGDDQVTVFALIEIDGIANVHANLGVLASDELYGAIARRLKETLPADAMCGRIGSNEFAVTVTVGPELDIAAMVRAALDAISRPHWIDTVVRISAHAGYAEAPRHAATRGELTRRAELALRAAARNRPGSIVVFEPTIDALSTDQKFIRRELPRALSANELELHYQPIVTAKGTRIIGVEALLRWNHAIRGQITSAAFIPVAEQMGLMDALGDFVLRRALHEAQRWPDLYVAVNLSPCRCATAVSSTWYARSSRKVACRLGG